MSVSWLTLEQYRSGALGRERAAEVEAALAADPDLRQRLAAIDSDTRPPPPLPAGLFEEGDAPADSGLPLPALSDEPVTLDDAPLAEVVPLRSWRRPVAVVGVLAALAAAMLLVVRPPTPGQESPLPAARVAWKGGELALRLDRDRAGQVTRAADAYQDGDRFQAALTCPPGEVRWELVAWQDGRAAFPLGTGQRSACGNGVVLPGAFRASGDSPITVCVAVGDRVQVDALAAGPEGLETADAAACVELAPLR